MEQQPSGGAVTAAATAGPPAAEPGAGQAAPELRSRVAIDDVMRRWQALCETTAFGATRVSFDDPRAVAESVLAFAGRPSEPSAAERIEHAVLRFLVHPGVAVVQLVALGRVLTRTPAATDRHRSAEAALDQAINLAIAAILDDLEQRGLVDPLTGLLNRRALDRDLVELVQASSRHDRSLVVVMADLEGLKATNDTLGHSAGDERLRRAAQTLTATVRTGDNVYRIGGDEFVILMPDLALRDLEAVLGRVDSATATPLSWGCAWSRIMPDVHAEREAARMLELADQRLLRYRWSGADDSLTRNDEGEIIAGRFGPSSDAPRRR